MKMDKKELFKTVDTWIEDLRLAEYETNTLTSYKHAIISFLNWVKEDEFVLDKDLLMDYKKELQENFETNSSNKYITIINKFLRLFYNNKEDWDKIKLKKIKKQQRYSIEDNILEQEHKRMLRWAKNLKMDDMYLIMKIFAYAGIRVVELKKFTVENITNNYIKVYNKGKERDVILRSDLFREIKHYCKDKKITTGSIFPSPEIKGQMIHPTTVWRRLKKIARRAKINPNKIHPHAWRHLFAKAFMKIPGNSIDELADILGHSKIETTRIYTMTSNKEKKSKLEKIKY